MFFTLFKIPDVDIKNAALSSWPNGESLTFPAIYLKQ